MASGSAVWGIDVGQCALKAIKIRPAATDGQVEAIAFDVIEHPKILSQPDADPDELIRAAIEKFASRNDWQHDQLVIGVPGQQTFSKFCKLPPVDRKDTKQIAKLVQFEAGQQIPFDMEDVVWDYETFGGEDSPNLEVGVFAMRKDLVRKQIDFYSAHGMSPHTIQAMPSALFNFAHFEYTPESEADALVLVDVGAQNTDLVVIEKDGAWTRNIPLGGNNFTEALIKAFKLSFAKAESLKRTAASSKYARQIFQAMRPIFAELVAEIQRSLGFYSSTHRDVELTQVLALGNAFQLPGLQKYLEQNLSISGGVMKLEKFKTLAPSATINAPQFTDNILSFGGAYGLALQGLGMTRISANLLPTELARIAVWKKKTPYWIGAAACLGLAAFCPVARNTMDKDALVSNDAARSEISRIINKSDSFVREFNSAAQDLSKPQERIERMMELANQRAMIPRILSLVHEAMPKPTSPALAEAESLEAYKAAAAQTKRTERKQFIIDELHVEFSDAIGAYEAPATFARRSSSSGRSRSAGPGGAAPGPFGFGGYGPPGGYGGGPGGYGGFGPPSASRRSPSEKRETSGDDGPGFYVHVAGKLLFGQTKADASRVIQEEYFQNLTELGRRTGLGFYVLPDEEEQKNFTPPTIESFSKDTRTRGNAAPGEIDPALLDPITGESMQTDWDFDFGFRVRIGDPNEKKPEPKAEEPKKKNKKK